jgi:tetratricopeptide (TPR) repeat protein
MTRPTRVFAALSLLAAAAIVTGCGGAADRKDRYLQRGEAYFTQQNYDKARVEYSNALQIDPKTAKARYFLGQIAERQGKAREAFGNYQAAVEIDPNDTLARAALARIYLLGGLPEKARELVEVGLKQAPNDPKLLTVRGAANAQAGRNEAALADAEAAYKLAPADEMTIALLASLYGKAGRGDDAIQVVTSGIAKLPKSVDLRVILAELQLRAGNVQQARTQLEGVIALEPKNLVHRQRLARLFLMNKDPAAAQAALRDAVKAVPDSVDMKLALVELVGADGGAEKAEAQMLEFVNAEPKNADLKLALGRLYEAHSKADKAGEVYQQIVTEEGVNAKGLLARDRLAAIAMRKNDTVRAEKLVGEVLKENARDNEALVLRADLALAKGDAPAAITDLRAVLRDQPDAAPVMRALAHAHQQNNEPALAEEALRNAVQVNPRDYAARMDLISLLAGAGRLDQAKPMLEQWISDAPTDLGAREVYSRMLLAQSDYEGAYRAAEEVQRLRPDLPSGALLAGQVHEQQKKFDTALADYEAALKVKPDSTDAMVALVRIDMLQKQPKRALGRLATGIEKYPDSPFYWNLQGEVLASQSQTDPAIKSFDEAIQRAPTWWIPYRIKALTQAAAQRSDDAVATLKQGYDKTSGVVTLATDLSDLEIKLGHPEESIKVYEGLVQRNPRELGLANNLAMLLVSYRSDKASLDRAEQIADTLARSPDPLLVDTRGWVKYKRGEYPDAMALLQQATEKLPSSPQIRYHLGMVQLKSGNKSAARESLETALKANGNFPGADEAREALKSAG